MSTRPHYPEAYRPGEICSKRKQTRHYGNPDFPRIDLRGVPTISPQLHATLADGKRPTYKQRVGGQERIRRACEEILRRREIAAEAAYQERMRLEQLAAVAAAVRRGRRGLYDADDD